VPIPAVTVQTPSDIPIVDTAPNTPASITTSTALEIEEDIYLEDEQDEEDLYHNDPDRAKRDLVINERVNRSLAEAEEAALIKEILSPRSAVKTVQFASRPTSPTLIVEEEEPVHEVMSQSVHVWDTFRDFVSVRSVTGFEEFVPQPRWLRAGWKESVEGPQDKEGVGRAKIVEVGKCAFVIEQRKVIDKEIPPAKTANSGVPKEEPLSTAPTAQTSVLTVSVDAPTPASSAASAVQTPAILTAPTSAAPIEPHPTLPTPLPHFAPAALLAASTPPPITAPLPTDAPKPTLIVSPIPTRSDIVPVNTAPHQVAQKNVATYGRPDVPYKNWAKFPPHDVLKDVAPARSNVKNTWDMPSVPSVEVDMGTVGERKDGGGRVDPFLLGLGDSKRVEEQVVVADLRHKETGGDNFGSGGWTSSGGWDSSSSSLLMSTPLIPTTPAKTTPAVAPAKVALAVPTSTPARPAPTKLAALPAAIAVPKSMVTSPKTSPVSERPVPPTPKPAVKTTAKPVIAPKPANLVQTPSSKTSFTPSFVDPFLAGLQRPNKSDAPARPKTPSVGTDSADSTPKRTSPGKENLLSIDVGSSLESAPTSPTSLSSSWTLVEKRKEGSTDKDTSPPAPPPTPTQASSRKTWFGTNVSPTATIPVATPLSTPCIPASTPITHVEPVLVAPSIPVTPHTSKPDAPQGRKLFTFELKVGQSIVSTPVHEMDDPRVVAEQFAREHDLEARLPGGRATVDKIVYYFESQYVERRREREKRRAERRERLKGSLTVEKR
jgi:hypothetical protein